MKSLFNPAPFVRRYFEDLGITECSFCVFKYDRRVRDMRRRFEWSSVETMETTLLRLEESLTVGEEVAIDSRCKDRSNQVRHLAMLDWRGRSAMSLSLVHDIGRLVNCSEFIVAASGRSFHVYYKALLSGEELQAFLAKAVLFEDEKSGVDYRWAAHRLLDGFATLRCSGTSWRHALEPHVMFKADPARRDMVERIRDCVCYPYAHARHAISEIQIRTAEPSGPTLWEQAEATSG